jgi:hypothetical protein
MSILSNLLLVASLGALSLTACTEESQCQGEECQPELIRIEVEVIGSGTVVVEGDEEVRCTGEQGLCSFSYLRGTDLIVYAEDSSSGGSDSQDACEGELPCYINLESGQVVVASFQDEGAGKPTKPIIIVEPIPSWYREYAQQSIDPATVASAE